MKAWVHLKAEAAVDRSRAMRGRVGYERHPDFGKGLRDAD